jgi:hypothetical protein
VSLERHRAAELESLAAGREVPFARLGESGGEVMVFEDLLEIPVARAREVYESAIPQLMSLRRAAG